jgi:hypothetical protein
MGWFGRDRLKMEEVAADLCKLVLRDITPDKLESLRQWGVNPDNPKHRLEIVILSLFCLRSSIPFALEKEQGTTLLTYIEHLLKISYVDVLKLGNTDQFETVLHQRYEEYNNLDTPGATIPRIGLRFSQNIGIDDMALVHWAEMTFRKVRLSYVDFLKNINEKYQLVC